MFRYLFYPYRSHQERMKCYYWLAKSAIRKMAIPFHAYRMMKDLESIKSLIASKEGALTATEGKALKISRESTDHTYFKWWKVL